jgi:hypothetical protein
VRKPGLWALAWASGLRPTDPCPPLLWCGDLHLENLGADQPRHEVVGNHPLPIDPDGTLGTMLSRTSKS